MKKSIFTITAAVAAMTSFAQTGDLVSKRGEKYLSESGDWGLTFDAQPLLNYAGNLLNGTSENGGAALNWANTMWAIQGKKLIDANTAYRGTVRIGFGSTKVTDLVDDVTNTDPSVTVEDVTKTSAFNLVLGGGIEKRKGSTRVVGVYGAQALIALGSGKTTYEYGNAINANNPVTSRTTEEKAGSTFGFGVGVFGGVEWFCAPKISLSGEYMWGFMLNSTGSGETTTEGWDPTANNGNGALETTTTETGKSSSFGLDTSISGLSIGLNFYFQ